MEIPTVFISYKRDKVDIVNKLEDKQEDTLETVRLGRDANRITNYRL